MQDNDEGTLHLQYCGTRPGGCRCRWLSCCCAAILLLTPAYAFPQRTIGDLVSDYTARGRSVTDLVLDAAGNLHIAWTVTENQNHEAGTLFYTRLDSSGRVSMESQITRFGGAYDIRIDVDSKDRASVLYRQLNRLCLASFDETGTMRTGPDRYLTSEETDARFESCRDESDNLYIVGRGSIDYFWKIDPSGGTLEERRGRWLRQQTPGFVCQLVSRSTLLFVWGLDDEPGKQKNPRKLRMLKFDLVSFTAGEPREYDVARVAEARESGIVLAQSRMIRSGRDILLFTSLRDSTSEAATYRVRFNAKGDPVRRWEMKRIYHLEVANPPQGHCSYTTGLLLVRRGKTRVFDLQGFGNDGNIYHLTGKIPALRNQ